MELYQYKKPNITRTIMNENSLWQRGVGEWSLHQRAVHTHMRHSWGVAIVDADYEQNRKHAWNSNVFFRKSVLYYEYSQLYAKSKYIEQHNFVAAFDPISYSILYIDIWLMKGMDCFGNSFQYYACWFASGSIGRVCGCGVLWNFVFFLIWHASEYAKWNKLCRE